MAEQRDAGFDVYSDSLQLTTGPYGIAIVFALSPSRPNPQSVPEEIGTVRMSLEHAKVMAMLLRRQLKEFERQAGFQIRVMPQAMNAAGLSDEDWGAL